MDTRAVVHDLVERVVVGVGVGGGRRRSEEVVDAEEAVGGAAEEEVRGVRVEGERCDIVVVGFGVLRLDARGAEVPV